MDNALPFFDFPPFFLNLFRASFHSIGHHCAKMRRRGGRYIISQVTTSCNVAIVNWASIKFERKLYFSHGVYLIHFAVENIQKFDYIFRVYIYIYIYTFQSIFIFLYK